MDINNETNPQDLAKYIKDIPPDALNKLSHMVLLRTRAAADPKDKEAQNKLAPPEHRAFAREMVEDNPVNAVPMALMALAYQPAKALGIVHGRSDASLEEMGAGLTGVAEGLSNYSTSKLEAMKKLLANL